MRILFVCLGNICRSPAAEIIFRKLVADAGFTHQIHIDSAGTAAYHCGKGPDPRMAATLKSRGYTISGKARQIQAADLSNFDLIIPMDEENLSNILALDPVKTHHHKIRSLTTYATRHSDTFVPDPYYGGQAGFDHVVSLLEDACGGILRQHAPKPA